MAKSKRRSTSPVPDAVREAVERTVQATVGSAQITRDRAQDAVDEVVKSAGQSRKAMTERVRGAIDERRPVTNEDIRELRTELRAIGRRLDAIEKRLPAPRARRGSSAQGAKKGGGRKRSS